MLLVSPHRPVFAMSYEDFQVTVHFTSGIAPAQDTFRRVARADADGDGNGEYASQLVQLTGGDAPLLTFTAIPEGVVFSLVTPSDVDLAEQYFVAVARHESGRAFVYYAGAVYEVSSITVEEARGFCFDENGFSVPAEWTRVR